MVDGESWCQLLRNFLQQKMEKFPHGVSSQVKFNEGKQRSMKSLTFAKNFNWKSRVRKVQLLKLSMSDISKSVSKFGPERNDINIDPDWIHKSITISIFINIDDH